MYIKENPKKLLTFLNFDYFKKAFDDINNNNYGKLKNIGIIYSYSFLRINLYYFVNLQINYNDLRDISLIHNFLYNKSNSELDKMIILYIAKIFTLFDAQEYFLNKLF